VQSECPVADAHPLATEGARCFMNTRAGSGEVSFPGDLYVAIFLFYISFCMIAVLNIVTGTQPRN